LLEFCRADAQLSSGYTVGDDGNRYVFTMNKKRYPDFKGMVSLFHEAGIKVVPNIKPCKSPCNDLPWR
jgi:alpha-glucosidase (family GH31 glycosyl hydrolase)